LPGRLVTSILLGQNQKGVTENMATGPTTPVISDLK